MSRALAPTRTACFGGAIASLAIALPAHAFCFASAAERYRVPEPLLRAIAEQESGNRPNAVGRNTNGSRDIGLMQINSVWLPTLARYGISENDLYDPCVSTLIGAWILSGNFARLGYSTQALGAYNAANPQLRERYAAQVLKRVPRYLPAAPPPMGSYAAAATDAPQENAEAPQQ